jgi:hypothetical protein
MLIWALSTLSLFMEYLKVKEKYIYIRSPQKSVKICRRIVINSIASYITSFQNRVESIWSSTKSVKSAEACHLKTIVQSFTIQLFQHISLLGIDQHNWVVPGTSGCTNVAKLKGFVVAHFTPRGFVHWFYQLCYVRSYPIPSFAFLFLIDGIQIFSGTVLISSVSIKLMRDNVC